MQNVCSAFQELIPPCVLITQAQGLNNVATGAALWRPATLHVALYAYLFVCTNLYMHNVVCGGVLAQKNLKGK